MFVEQVCSMLMYYLTTNIECSFTCKCQKSLIFVKFDDRSLLYTRNKPWIISFKVKNLLVPALPIKKNVLEYYDTFVFYTWYHQILIFVLCLIV